MPITLKNTATLSRRKYGICFWSLNDVADSNGENTTVMTRPRSEAISTMRLTSLTVKASTFGSASLPACEIGGTADTFSPIRANCWMVLAAELNTEEIPIPVECRIWATSLARMIFTRTFST